MTYYNPPEPVDIFLKYFSVIKGKIQVNVPVSNLPRTGNRGYTSEYGWADIKYSILSIPGFGRKVLILARNIDCFQLTLLGLQYFFILVSGLMKMIPKSLNMRKYYRSS
jgi:hypothetical protein